MRGLDTFRQRIAAAQGVFKAVAGSSRTPRKIARFIYADTALMANRGHHANFARHFAQAAKDKGVGVMVVANTQVDPALRAELEALPLFRVYTYGASDPDPVCGWLTGFFSAAEKTRQDLEKIPALGPQDLVFLSSAQPAQLMAAIDWAKQIPFEQCPVIVVELGSEPGVIVMSDGKRNEGLGIPHPQADSRPTLFRFAASRMGDLNGKPFHVVNFEPAIAALYERLMEQPVGVLPFPMPATIPVRNRRGRRPVTVAVLGHQQLPKGYGLMPEVVERLKEERDVRFLIHNSDSEQKYCGRDGPVVRVAHQKLQALAARDPRVIMDERKVDLAGWRGLMEDADLVLCPYDPRKYATAHSGLAAEALANGIPLVVPAKTSLSHWLDDFGQPGVTFDKFEARAVVAAVRRALKEFDLYADRAFAAAGRWAETQGPDRCMSEMFTLKPVDYRSSGQTSAT